MDASLLQLEEDATAYGASVVKIYSGGKPAGTPVTVVGMGYNDDDAVNNHHKAHLRYYNSIIVQDANCLPDNSNYIPKYFMCVGIEGDVKRTGYGDSGGPCYVRNNKGELEAAGIVGGGVKDKQGKEPSFIRFYYGWSCN